ncbi:MAG: hypothetical protein Q8K59_02785 [Nitrosomonas sp.]|nr:hypothetical protein [Nitrosomonas sp.]MDP1950016.1 hypothetical protein [Nitrosomonas sp.]
MTKRGKQASRKAAARKYGFLEVPLSPTDFQKLGKERQPATGGGYAQFNRRLFCLLKSSIDCLCQGLFLELLFTYWVSLLFCRKPSALIRLR